MRAKKDGDRRNKEATGVSKIKVSIKGHYEVKEVPYGKDYVCAPARRTVSRLRRVGRTPFREPLQFIVMGVIGVISLYL